MQSDTGGHLTPNTYFVTYALLAWWNSANLTETVPSLTTYETSCAAHIVRATDQRDICKVVVSANVSTLICSKRMNENHKGASGV